MPIFPNGDRPKPPDPAALPQSTSSVNDDELREQASENIRCENVEEMRDLGDTVSTLSTSPTKAVLAAIDDTSLGISDRVKLIERIKRGESPTWQPIGTVSSSLRSRRQTYLHILSLFK